MVEIPEKCLALWKQLHNGPVVVHEQEITKAEDIRLLFELGLIRFTRSDGILQPSVKVFLSEEGMDLCQAQVHE